MRGERLSTGSEFVKKQLLNSKLADIAREVLPESTKRFLRETFYGEKASYPLSEPITVSISGVESRFWILNHSDWYRIGRNDFELEYASKLIETVTTLDDPTFVDIGSAQGFYSIMVAQAGAQVVAVDPDPISNESLAANIKLNPRVDGRINPVNLALGDRQGQFTFHIDREGIYAPSMKQTVRGLKETIVVPVTTMDEMIKRGDMARFDIAKIDVEGAEGIVIEGMKETLSSAERPSHLFIELHRKYLPLFGSTHDEVDLNIRRHGYRLEESWDRRSETLCHYTSSC